MTAQQETFIAHLVELRDRMIKALLVVLVLAVGILLGTQAGSRWALGSAGACWLRRLSRRRCIDS